MNEQQVSNDIRKTEEKLKSAMEHSRNQGHETLDKVTDTISSTVKDAEKKFKDVAKGARAYTTQTSDNLAKHVQNNPLTALACAAGLGALLAILMRS